MVYPTSGECDTVDVRFNMLETLREFAATKLREDEHTALSRRHVDYYLTVVQKAERELSGGDQAVWLARLESEHDNLRAALEWCKSSPERTELGRRLATALWRFWDVRGYHGEGRKHLADLLEKEGVSLCTAARAKALNAAGNLAAEQGDYAAARDLFEQSLQVQRELGNRRGVACLLNNLGLVAKGQGDHEAARTYFDESLRLHRELNDSCGIASSLANQGSLSADLRDFDRAREFYEESLAIQRKTGNQSGIAALQNNLGNIARMSGDVPRARSLFEEALALNRQTGNQGWEATNLYNLGCLSLDAKDCPSALVLFFESLKIWCGLGDKRGIASGLEKLVALWQARGQFARAAQLSGAATAIRKSIGTPLPPSEQAEYERILSVVCDALGEDSFLQETTLGETLTMEAAVRLASQPEPDDRSALHKPAVG
jgi:tetratricopeptide (TPR) repeat protein